MTKLQKRRLLKLADFLENDPVVQDHFDLALFNSAQFRDIGPTARGSTACAIGWCPIVFPTLWTTDENGFPRLKSSDHDYINSFNHTRFFFGLSHHETTRLFMPDEYPYEDTTKPWVVARRIREFVSREK